MKNTFFLSALRCWLLLFFTSCKTYFIPVESFKQQFAVHHSSVMREVTTQGPLGGRETYKVYPIDHIRAIDKNGNLVTLQSSPSIEIRITDTANHKTIFYFDSIQFDGENITGTPSRFISSVRKTIPILSVRKIEVQDGRKNVRYTGSKR